MSVGNDKGIDLTVLVSVSHNLFTRLAGYQSDLWVSSPSGCLQLLDNEKFVLMNGIW